MAKINKKHYVSSDERSAEDRALERFADMVVEKIEAIKSDWKKPWFTENTLSWPKNLSGREYNGMNAFMLYLQCESMKYQIPVFMTFEQVRGLNYKGNIKEGKRLTDKEGNLFPEVSVLKGAKSFPVFLTIFTVIDTERNRKIKFDDYKKLSGSEQEKCKVYPKLQVYNVFNVAQTNIQEARPELYAKLMAENVVSPPEISADGYCFPAMDEMLRNNEWLCPVRVEHQNRAYYSITKDEIVIPEKEQFYNAELFYGTGLHEMIHSTGAKQRLDRFSPNTYFGSSEYAKEELVAELGSALVMQKNGICKTIKEESCAYLKNWLEGLKESPSFIKSILLDVKRSTAMVNERFDLINSRLMGSESVEKIAERLPLTGIPDGAVSEFHMLDNESCNAVFEFLKSNFQCRDTDTLVEVSKPSDRVVRIDGKCFDDALECVYGNLDSETLSKIVDCGNYIEGHLVDNYASVLNLKFSQEFERKRNDPNWLKEQGIEGEVKWDLRFIPTDGYHIVKAITENQNRIGALDYHCSVFRPFVDVGENFNIEDDLGYMTELRRRLLSKDERVDPLGRITFAAPPVQDVDTGNIRRDILIDGEAKAVFILEPNSNIYDLNFILELKKSDLVKRSPEVGYGNIIHDKENDIYYTLAQSIYDLFYEKDRFYPVRVIDDKVNMVLKDYLNLSALRDTETVVPVQNEVAKQVEVDRTNEREEVYPGLYAFRNNDKLWGLQDDEGRIIRMPRWGSFERQEDSGLIIFRDIVSFDGEVRPNTFLPIHKKALVDIADKISRLSNIHVEERGEHKEKWIAGDVDGVPAVSSKICDIEWNSLEGRETSVLELALEHFAEYLAHPKEELKSGIRM